MSSGTAARPASCVDGEEVLRTEAHDDLALLDEVHGRESEKGRDEHVGRLVVDVRGRSDLADLPEIHHHDPVSHRHGLDLVVRHVDRGRPDALVELFELLPGRRPQLGVQVGERFVQQEHRRLAHDGARERDPLPLAPGKLARLTVQELADAQQSRGPLHLLAVLLPGDFLRFERESDVLVDRKVGIEGVALEDHGDPPLARRELIHDAAAD